MDNLNCTTSLYTAQIIGDDREYPILRLQPKVSFDVSV